jgi:hypothetical protein
LILVGIADDPGPERTVGVSEREITRISDSCSNLLDPPYVPEIIPLRLPSEESKYILVIRVYPESSTRPIIINGKVFVRSPGRNDGADQTRIRHLFTEENVSTYALNSYLPAPNVILETPPLDVFIRTGLIIPVNPAFAGRPLSERAVKALIDYFQQSPLHNDLIQNISQLDIAGFNDFRKEGFNRSRIVRLSWQAVEIPVSNESSPVECIIEINSTSSGIQPPKTMQITLDFILRQSAYMSRQHPTRWLDGSTHPISVMDLYRTLEAILGTIIHGEFLVQIARLAGIEVHQVPRPMSMHITTPRGIAETLARDNLRTVPLSPSSYGAQLVGDSSLNLSIDSDMREQLDQWMIQLALDGSLEGMDSLLEIFHRDHP